MKGIIPFNCQQSSPSHWTPVNNNILLHKQVEALEPCSVLDQTTSPSPSPSPSPSSSHSAGVAALSDNHHHRSQRQPNSINGGDKDEHWASELHPIPPPTGLLTADSLDDWEAVLSGAAAAASPATQQQTFLNWITGDVQDTMDGEVDPGFQHPFATPPSLTTTTTVPSVLNCLPMLNNNNNNNNYNPSFFINHHQLSNSTFSLPSPGPEAHNPKRHCSIARAHQHQPVVDQLFKAAEFIERGNLFGAREILARLNQILPGPPVGFKPVIRSAFIFKEAIGALLSGSPSSIPSNPLDVVLKLSSYKAFSEVSPLTHFTNFTCAQTLLEEVGGFDRIHIVDFDIGGGGGGGNWSSFIQELASRRSGALPSLKITAFVSTPSFHPLELHLTRENLIHFASELKIPFEFSFFAIESFDPNELLAVSASNEALAVNLPVGFDYPQTFPMILRLVKQLNPKIVVSVDQGYHQNFIHLFQPLVLLLDSIDASGTSGDIVDKIERFLIQPRIENAVLGRYRTAAKIAPWREIFASVGFAQGQFSNFTEAQAECLLKRVQVRGFHVEKRQGSMFLYWQRGELGSVSAWKC